MITPFFDRTFDDFFNHAFSFNLGNTNVEQIRAENGDFELYIDALGHDPKDIDIQITPTKLTIKSEKQDNSSILVKPINLKCYGRRYSDTPGCFCIYFWSCLRYCFRKEP